MVLSFIATYIDIKITKECKGSTSPIDGKRRKHVVRRINCSLIDSRADPIVLFKDDNERPTPPMENAKYYYLTATLLKRIKCREDMILDVTNGSVFKVETLS